MNPTQPARGDQAGATFYCAGCRKTRAFSAFGAALTNELFDHEGREGAPICEGCVTRARASRKSRRRTEERVRRARRAGLLQATVCMPGAALREQP